MSKVFNKSQGFVPKVKRNTFDLSHQNNLSCQMGVITPFLCMPTLPGDTFRIKDAYGIRAMPLAFPIQTKVRVDVKYFYVRLRNLMKDFPDFIGNNATAIEFPRLSRRRTWEQSKTASLGDYLGMPSTIVGQNLKTSISGYRLWTPQSNRQGYFPVVDPLTLGTNTPLHYPPQASGVPDDYIWENSSQKSSFVFGDILPWLKNVSTAGVLAAGDVITLDCTSAASSDPNNLYVYLWGATPYQQSGWTGLTYYNLPISIGQLVKGDNNKWTITFHVTGNINLNNQPSVFLMLLAKDKTKDISDYRGLSVDKVSLGFRGVVEASDVYTAQLFPYQVSALPFRAYESIYNAFYRDQRNNPYLVNGVNKPNQYIPTQDSGIDDNIYELRRANWEQDFLTSSLPSPQMGAAPLVGITSTGVATFQSDDGQTYQVKMEVGDDGETITGASYATNLPNDVARSVVNYASQGISINDFRAVNSLQRWLEANFRLGLKYVDQLKSHFGVDAKYSVLDMPEFLGGHSSMLDINQINQTSADTDSSPLGSFAGQASAVASSNHDINHYCDEHGYIIGLLTIVPVPCYSQLLPKDFTKTSPLDFYFPEFGHIGFQPVPYREVTPLQAAYHSLSLDSTFGYQRPWYDYLSETDKVHALFRTDYRDFVLSRVFDTVPSLNPDFLTVNEDQMNDVFAVSDSPDRFLGQIHLNILAKRPIPRYGVPRLE